MKMKSKKGVLIAAMGIPSVGKSSVIKELGKLLGCKTFLEPEEKDWGMAVKDIAKNIDEPSNVLQQICFSDVLESLNSLKHGG